MKIYHFGPEQGHQVTAFDSHNLSLTGILHHSQNVRMACMRIGSEGLIGMHPASTHQLFLVIEGEGMVTGREGMPYRIKPGFAAFWEQGELHETRSQSGLTAFVLEGDLSDLKMKEVEWSNV